MNPLTEPLASPARTPALLKPPLASALLAVALGFPGFAAAQQSLPAAPPVQNPNAASERPPGTEAPPIPGGRPDGFPGGPGGFPGGPGGFPGGPGGRGPMRQEVKLLEKFDKDGDEVLNAEERKAARESLAKDRAEGRGPRRFGPPPGMRRETQTPPSPGPKVTPDQVKSYPAAPLYDPLTLRTLFLDFENADWEKELADFHDTDVEVPVKLQVDGKTYEDVGVHFRGMSSFMMVGEGQKRSLSLSMDFVKEKQRLGGYRTLHLLNGHEDASYIRPILYCQIAREYIPAPKANLVRVVINGESWGIYANVQNINKDFTEEWFGSKKGARWTAPGSPMGDAGLEYLGDDVAEYKKRFAIKSKDDPKAWADLINFCKVLNETPADQLESKLAGLLDIDGALKFLALENVFINNDGYWIRSSDFTLYEDEKGCFHVLPHDTNETFSLPGGPGFGPGGPGGRGGMAGGPGGPGGNPGGPGGNPGFPGGGRGPRIEGVALDPLAGADNPKKALLSKLLAVPALRAKYLGYIREMAETWLDWNKLGPIVEQYHALIAADVKTETRGLESFEAFEKSVSGEGAEPQGRGPGRSISLKRFVEERRAFLLNHPEIKKTIRTPAAPGS